MTKAEVEINVGDRKMKLRPKARAQAAARLVAEAIGDSYTEAVAKSGGLSAGGVCAALREMVGSADAEGSLRRVRQLVMLESEVSARLVELAMMLQLNPAEASLPNIVAKLRALEAEKKDAVELIDAASARTFLGDDDDAFGSSAAASATARSAATSGGRHLDAGSAASGARSSPRSLARRRSGEASPSRVADAPRPYHATVFQAMRRAAYHKRHPRDAIATRS